MRTLILFWLLVGPAQAEVDFRKDEHARGDLAVLSACFDAAETWEAAQDCVNLTYEPCIERLGREAAHVDQAGCNSRELALWDHLLTAETRKLEAWTLLKDNEISAKSDRQPFAHQSFLDAQVNWEAYRKAQCEFDVVSATGRTSGMTIIPHCQMALVVERLFSLRLFLAQIEAARQP